MVFMGLWVGLLQIHVGLDDEQVQPMEGQDELGSDEVSGCRWIFFWKYSISISYVTRTDFVQKHAAEKMGGKYNQILKYPIFVNF